MHSLFLEPSPLPTDDCHRPGLLRLRRELTISAKERLQIGRKIAFDRHHDDLSAQARTVPEVIVEIQEVDRDDLGFDASRWRRSCPTHCAYVKGALQRDDELGARDTPRPPLRKSPLLGMNVREANGFHLVRSPGDSLFRRRRTGNAGADVVTELREPLIREGLHHACAGDLSEVRSGTIVVGATGGCLRISLAGQAELSCQQTWQYANQ